MKQDRVDSYPRAGLWSSLKDWHKGWFYLKNHDGVGRLSKYNLGSLVPHEDPDEWSWGPDTGERHRLNTHLQCIGHLKEHLGPQLFW
jgi:hypothetical protein